MPCDTKIPLNDIKKNLKRWTPRGKSIFYLTRSYWYQLRADKGKICIFRQSIRTMRIDRDTISVGDFMNNDIGRTWLKKPAQAKKRRNKFFSFLAKTGR